MAMQHIKLNHLCQTKIMTSQKLKAWPNDRQATELHIFMVYYNKKIDKTLFFKLLSVQKVYLSLLLIRCISGNFIHI